MSGELRCHHKVPYSFLTMNGPYLLRDNVGASLVESDLLIMEILGSGLEAKDCFLSLCIAAVKVDYEIVAIL